MFQYDVGPPKHVFHLVWSVLPDSQVGIQTMGMIVSSLATTAHVKFFDAKVTKKRIYLNYLVWYTSFMKQ